MRIHRWFSMSVGHRVALAMLFAWLALFLDTRGAAAQTCAAGPVFVDGTSCTVTAGSSITVSQAAVPGLDARNAGVTITAQGITVQLGPGVVPRTFVGAQALTGAAVELSGSTIITSQAGTSQRGVISDGLGSNISATGLTITLGTGATTVNDNLAVLAQNGGMARFTNSAISTRGAVNGIANHAVTATGSGSTVTLIGGTVSTASRGSFGVQAADGGHVVIGGGAQVTTTGVQNLSTTPCNHRDRIGQPDRRYERDARHLRLVCERRTRRKRRRRCAYGRDHQYQQQFAGRQRPFVGHPRPVGRKPSSDEQHRRHDGPARQWSLRPGRRFDRHGVRHGHIGRRNSRERSLRVRRRKRNHFEQ
ncbi:hypothetical protein HFO63_34295 [Rhizobium laguerreae]|uniref:hypothetical protein n=1 Tax=Rhizobium laguerreae TaxID=1076926 RepID=UPI001C905E4C|nr:hypothetical protein [Rhizobium laguerreae]MBY3088635.1 hypothetical protein [Rhizobium laguerreae]MBY3150563.1 hypothetical protein [Rhizobium laguerreae]